MRRESLVKEAIERRMEEKIRRRKPCIMMLDDIVVNETLKDKAYSYGQRMSEKLDTKNMLKSITPNEKCSYTYNVLVFVILQK